MFSKDQQRVSDLLFLAVDTKINSLKKPKHFQLWIMLESWCVGDWRGVKGGKMYILQESIQLTFKEIQNLQIFVLWMWLRHFPVCLTICQSSKKPPIFLVPSPKPWCVCLCHRPPASWDEATLEGLGPLAFYANSTTWASINQVVGTGEAVP